MFSGYYGRESQRDETPREQCARLLLELNLEIRKEKPDLDKITKLKWRLAAFNTKDLNSAFDEVVDKHGWGDVGKTTK